MDEALGPRLRRYDQAEDRTLFWTLSLYVARDRLEAAIGARMDAEHVRRLLSEDPASALLRDAIEPLFNDVADRERLGRIDDTLLAADENPNGELVEISAPATIEWETEGKLFRASPKGLSTPRRMALRRFWFAHGDGGLSYHLSFQLRYEHTPGDFYFLSMLQKMVAPKEFKLRGRKPSDLPEGAVSPLADEPTGCLPLDAMRASDGAVADAPFWGFVKRRFEQDAARLLARLALTGGKTSARARAFRAIDLIAETPFIETPGLRMPVCRFMFYFQDKDFFGRLLPPVRPETGERPSRAQMCREECYRPYAAKIDELLAQDDRSGAQPVIALDDAYWTWVATRPDYADHLASLTPEARVQFEQDMRRERPAFDGDWTRPDCLQFLFMSGFNQNIIDFMNQDASEVQDSLDPIYPVNDTQEAESFFVRFANPRALVSYAGASRSLETGQDYIGTCPYAFLIHVSALHNEFIARGYETATFQLIAEVERSTRQGRVRQAMEAFYRFRTGPYSSFRLARYQNYFRYDTERDVFSALERLRGTTRREALLETLVANIESQTRDLEMRTSRQDDKRLGLLLGALGVFGLFQLAFDWADGLRRLSADGGMLSGGALAATIRDAEFAERVEFWTLLASSVSVVLIVGYAIAYLARRLMR